MNPHGKTENALPEVLTGNSEAEFITSIIAPYRDMPGALIPLLQAVQQKFGYLSDNALRSVSDGLGLPLAKVFGVVTFYSFFSRVPRGKFLIRVCLGTACYVLGAADVLDCLQKELEIGVGQTTSDGIFTLDVGRCFGACGLAPVIMINDTVHQQVRPSQVPKILAGYRKSLLSALENGQ
ncbi:MAG: NADH-quinone oxidoreductase subunit NuoE [Chitinivibrionales bacterium]|nr:NADH-quinone oxidoreductase subunit NuoE [Chitinivibrionales bacterium]